MCGNYALYHVGKIGVDRDHFDAVAFDEKTLYRILALAHRGTAYRDAEERTQSKGIRLAAFRFELCDRTNDVIACHYLHPFRIGYPPILYCILPDLQYKKWYSLTDWTNISEDQS